MKKQIVTKKQNLDVLTTEELADRWGMSEHSLRVWRSMKKGPVYFNIGRLVRYRIQDIEAYEAQHRSAKRKRA